uniref:Transmembrane protein n=1 Tax=Plectus sambesii TaxID=2011161 RepID=A0A914VC09_9BILA
MPVEKSKRLASFEKKSPIDRHRCFGFGFICAVRSILRSMGRSGKCIIFMGLKRSLVERRQARRLPSETNKINLERSLAPSATAAVTFRVIGRAAQCAGEENECLDSPKSRRLGRALLIGICFVLASYSLFRIHCAMRWCAFRLRASSVLNGRTEGLAHDLS